LITEFNPDLDQDIQRRFGTAADDARVKRTASALQANGIDVLRAADAADAKRIVLGLIPAGSQVHHGASRSLEVSGITEAIEKVRSLRSRPPADLEHGSQDPGRRDPSPDLVT
jgi:LUD domain